MQTDIPFKNLCSFCEELLNEQKEFKAKVTKTNATDNAKAIACFVSCKHIIAIAEKYGLKTMRSGIVPVM